METPKIIVVTGRPGAGKTTLAQRLSAVLRLPVISRDQLKEGFASTHGLAHAELPPDTNRTVTETFFAVISILVDNKVSFIAEAAFQQKVWAPKLTEIAQRASIRLIICESSEAEIQSRIGRRLREDPEHGRLHGVAAYGPYEAPKIDSPTMTVDTSLNYRPSILEIVSFIKTA